MISSNKSRFVEIKFFKYKVNRIKILLKLISEENGYNPVTYGMWYTCIRIRKVSSEFDIIFN